MRWFRVAQQAAVNISELILQDQETTPYMWAFRTGAKEVFEATKAHLAMVSEGESQDKCANLLK